MQDSEQGDLDDIMKVDSHAPKKRSLKKTLDSFIDSHIGIVSLVIVGGGISSYLGGECIGPLVIDFFNILTYIPGNSGTDISDTNNLLTYGLGAGIGMGIYSYIASRFIEGSVARNRGLPKEK
jgi:hypothetical protein